MIIYEVTAIVDPSIVDEYEKYMREQHISELLATGYFAAAFFAKTEDMFRIGYHCDSRKDLEAYFANHAGRLRAEMAVRFPEGVEFSRNELEIIALFPEP